MRDKNISIRVDSKKLDKFKEIVDKNTSVNNYYSHKYYTCKFGKQSWLSNKYSLADLVEEALEQFITDNS